MESQFFSRVPRLPVTASRSVRRIVRRIGAMVFFATLVSLLATNWTGAAWAGDDDDDMTFEPDQVNQPKDKGKSKGKSKGKGKSGDKAKANDKGESGGNNQSTGGVTEGEPEPEPEFEPDPVTEPEPEPDLDKDLANVDTVKANQQIQLSESRVSWQDIVVVVRKPFLKTGRVELLPLVGVTMNDNIIQHVSFGGQANYYLTDVLAVGLEGAFYAKNLREPFDLVARQARRLPTVNKYNFSLALDFSYVPVYGKFAIVDKSIVHWEVFFTAGVGITQSEVIPFDPALDSFTNILVTPNVGASMRFFLTKFMTVTVGVRDYVFVDKFEATDRTEMSGADAKANADSTLVNNVMFQAGLSFWIPPSFEYTTFR